MPPEAPLSISKEGPGRVWIHDSQNQEKKSRHLGFSCCLGGQTYLFFMSSTCESALCSHCVCVCVCHFTGENQSCEKKMILDENSEPRKKIKRKKIDNRMSPEPHVLRTHHITWVLLALNTSLHHQYTNTDLSDIYRFPLVTETIWGFVLFVFVSF